MAETGSNQENESKLQQEQDEQVYSNEKTIKEEEVKSETSDLPNASSIPQMDAPDDEKSAFFEQWKAKHVAYLASLEQDNSLVQEPDNKKEGNFLGTSKLKKVKKSKEKSQKLKKQISPLPSSVFLKAVPVIGLSILFLLLSLYFISPTSKNKKIEVSGNQRLTVEQIEKYSLISPKDYILTIFLNASKYAENIKKSSTTVETANIKYQLPNKFTIQIKEYAAVGYIQEENTYLPVLASGELASETTTVEQLPDMYTTINLSDRNLIKKLAIELGELDDEIRSKIQTINLTPSAVTADFLTFNMTDGNTVLVPLSEVSQKMVYYPKIASEVTTPTTIDMEVGVFRYPTQ